MKFKIYAVYAVFYAILAGTALSVTSCKDEPKEFQTVPTLPVYTNTNAAPTPPVELDVKSVSFYSTELKDTFITKFKVFHNGNHPNGYVIIKEFGVKTNMVKLSVTELEYIRFVHTGLIMDSNLTWFRTAEAAAITYYMTERELVDELQVMHYGKLMKGRYSGFPATSTLR